MDSSPLETPGSRASDLEINRLWLAGDPEAVARAHVRYRGRLEAVAFRIVRDRDDAEDVVQRVFVALQRVAARGTASLWTYLYRSAVNGSLSLLRARKRRAELLAEHLPALRSATGSVGEGAEDRVLDAEMHAAVSEALRKVRPKYRRVLVLRIVSNLTNTEIARREGVPLATVNTHLRRGREELRRLLRPLLRELGRNAS